MPENRYLRQRKLLGKQEEKLHALSVATVGMGGIGSFSALLCMQLGVRKLVLIDREKVRSTDLGRQVVYEEADVGKAKVEAAKKKLLEINPSVEVEARFEQLEERNARELLEDVHLVLDGTDNYDTRVALNRYCVKEGKPCIFSSALKSEGWVFSFVPGKACFECWAPVPKEELSCEQVGVLNTTVALAASLQVQEMVGLVCHKKPRIINKILRFDFEGPSFGEIKVEKRKECPACSSA